jgi:uncharacterized protein YbjT (DUF2867 family)
MAALSRSDDAVGRRALLVGATGLVGRALLRLLLEGDAYARVTVLARSARAGASPSPKLDWRTVDFDRLPAHFPHVDDVYVALGTTIAVAGSEAAFRHVDHDIVVAVAQAGRAAGAERLGVVSALGADARSRVFYNRVKGDMELAVARLGYRSVVIAQPSLLMGDRAALGQPLRRGEVLAARILAPVMGLVPKAIRPIAASTVARALVDAVTSAPPGVQRLPSARMQAHAAR